MSGPPSNCYWHICMSASLPALLRIAVDHQSDQSTPAFRLNTKALVESTQVQCIATKRVSPAGFGHGDCSN